MPSKSQTATQQKLVKELKGFTKEVKGLGKEVERLKKLEFVRVLNKPGRLIWLSFLKGMAAGLGSVIGATVLVALLIYILSQISFVPIVGDFIADVLDQIKSAESAQ